jgi:hypothetical protein
MFNQQGAVVGVIVLALVALAYVMMKQPPAAAKATLATPQHSIARLAPKSSPAKKMGMSERARITMDRRDVFGPAVAKMHSDMVDRSANARDQWVAPGETSSIGDYNTQYGEDTHTDRLVNALPPDVSASHQNYVSALRESRGAQGRTNLHPGYGAEFEQTPIKYHGIWPLLRGVKSLEGKHNMNAQVDSVTHCHGEDQFARLIGRPQYDHSSGCGQDISSSMVAEKRLSPHRAQNGVTTRAKPA